MLMLAGGVETVHNLESGGRGQSAYCFADWFGHEEELPQITVVHLAQDFNLQNSNRIGISKACPELNQKIADQRQAITRTS
jgi:hypothetical protein